MEIKKDEFELLDSFVLSEVDSIERQLVWYKNHDPQNAEHINSRETYAKRLKLLRDKLNDTILGAAE